MIPRRTAFFLFLNVLFLLFNVYLLTYDPDEPTLQSLSEHIAKRKHFIEEDDSSLETKPSSGKRTPEEKSLLSLVDAPRDAAKPPGSEEKNYAKLRESYTVETFRATDLVNCADLIAGKESELQKAEHIVATQPKIPIQEESYLQWTENCEDFKRKRGYITVPLTQEEENYPLAYGISMYTDVEQAERLLRSIYHPQNLYCFHIDIKSSLLLHRTIQRLTECFPNVFIAYHLDKIKWGDVSILYPDMNCMRHLIKYYRGKFKYYINLTGQEMMLRTNWEMVQIAKLFNGGNDIAGARSSVEMDRVEYKWAYRWSRTYQQTIFYNTYERKDPPPVNVTFFKGELHGFFSHNFAQYLVEDPVSQAYLEWCSDSGHPSEHYWNVLNYNKHLKAPGGYDGPLDEADEYGYHPAMRVKNWVNLSHYNGKTCEGKVVRGICVYGVRDVPWLASRPEMAANKLHLTYHYLAYDCLEERLRNRTALKGGTGAEFPLDYYKNIPTVKYSRKDGLDGV